MKTINFAPKENVTNRKLMNWHNEIAMARQQDSIFARFFASKISEFYKNNKIRIESINERYRKLEDEFLESTTQIGEGGKTLKQPVFEGEGNDRKRKIVEGKTREEYQAALDTLLNEVVSVAL